ncbi:MAG: GntR family transcriptional regulator [SAR324 cluster bacterium]|nr:GntR family transcriptional regulator [SAR324 cluster bacterium]
MNPTEALPQYRQVADTLRRRIRNGEYRQGQPLPTQAELERIFQVSGITIRKALGILAGEGRVRGRRGVGTLVMPGAAEEKLAIKVSGNFREWLESASGQNHPIEQEVLDIAVAPGPADIAAALALPLQAPLWRMRRLRRIAGRPISHHVNYGAPARFAQVTAATMAPSRSFVEVMRAELGIVLARMDQRVEAMVAERDLAEILETGFGAPLFMVENRYLDPAGAVVAVTLLYLRGDRYVYQSSIPLEEEAPRGKMGNGKG